MPLPRLFPVALALGAGCASLAADRVPWTASHVHGSPEPPAPYRIERAFPKLTFSSPLDLVTLPGTKRMVIVEQRGRLFSIPDKDDCSQADLFADLKQFDPEAVEAYAIAFHPHFAENRLAYVWMNLDLHGKPNRENGTRIVRFKVTGDDPPRLDITSGKTIFTWVSGGHNGGTLRFGPDGMLYISAGDTATPDPPDPLATGQDISDIPSSVLRIDVDHTDPGLSYAIPKDNPFVGTPGARGEVWAYGFRNPWRMSFDSKTGDLWVGDVGWELWEMIYRVQRGGNYGWSITEGGKQDVRPDRSRGPTPILPPVMVHSHEEAASITGGEVYHGKKLPDLEGAYIYGDWQLGTFWSLRMQGDRVVEQRELCRSTLLPVGFGTTPDGELLVCDQGAGGIWRFEKNPEAGKPSAFPRHLSETGLFSDVVAQKPSPGVIPYAVHAPRWADFATGERWIALPDTSTITLAKKELGVMSKGRWNFPADAVLAKTYSLEMERGNAATRRRIETQVLHFDGVQWAAYSYRWNETQTDAELVPARGAETTFDVKDAAAPSGTRHQTWRYFSRAECLRCHNMWNNFAPGFSTVQLDRTASSPLDALLSFPLPPDENKLADPYDVNASVETRARSYLHTNCSTCHRFGGGGSVPSMMNIEAALPQAKLIGVNPVQGSLGLPEARVIAPGDPCRSALLYRMTTAGRGHMPYLGGRLVDDRAIVVMRDWIAGMQPESNLPEAVRTQREAERKAVAQLKAGDAAPLDSLLATPSGALDVALARIDGSLTGDVAQKAVAQGSALADPLKRDFFERFLPESQRRQVLGSNFSREAILAGKGDAEHGRVLFSAICSACHRVGDVGRAFGPDLTHIASKYQRAALLEQIIEPSKTIEPQWQLTTVALKNGESVSGFVTARDSDALTLQLADGQSRKIAAGDVQSSTVSRVSLMPEHLIEGLTQQEAADLLDFLAASR